MSTTLNVLLILGSVRHGRMVERVSKLVQKSLQKYTQLSVSTLDPLSPELNHEMNRQPMHFLQNSGEIPDWMKNANQKILKANGFILLSTEYNGMMPPALLNLMNTIPPLSFRHRPCGIVTYTMGNSGAMRALTNARPYASELGMLVVPGYVPIPMVHEVIDAEGECSNSLVNANLEKLVKNLEWYAEAINGHHNKGGFPD